MMERFDKILCNEGMPFGEGRFPRTLFTHFSMTCDYRCWPHNDDTNYGYNIIVWLYLGMTTSNFSFFVCKVCIDMKFICSFLVNAHDTIFCGISCRWKASCQKIPSIWLLEYYIQFSMRNDSTFVVNCRDMVHCLTKKRSVGLLAWHLWWKGIS